MIIGRRPGALLVRTGIALFVVGLLVVLVTVVPFLFGARERPLWLGLACLSTPVGLVLALVGLARGTRDVRRRGALAAAGTRRRQDPAAARRCTVVGGGQR
ncbi:MAG TPA: hypothetical protein VFX70_18525 [Mycobacteriales bacterium]|nr:hypothetical protein [Mycobacteriales bacterium]